MKHMYNKQRRRLKIEQRKLESADVYVSEVYTY